MNRRLETSTLCRVVALIGGVACAHSPQTRRDVIPAAAFEVLIRQGTLYDGSGAAPRITDVGIVGDSIAAVGDLHTSRGRTEVDARGLAVSPGFINMLSHSEESLIQDGRGLSDIVQGVTLEVMGEGESMGPLNAEMKRAAVDQQGDIKYDVPWTTLGEYLGYLERRGVSLNVASFVGATTARIHEVGYVDRPPTPDELLRMQSLVKEAMEDGALGVGSALIYAPGFYARTDELVALMKAAAPYGGMYISHMRSEGNRFLEAIDELLTIARESGAPAEIYHLKQAGASNWAKYDRAIAKIDSARSGGARITADMYMYTAGATGLDASMPPWVQEGGYKEWAKRLQDPVVRARLAVEMRSPTDAWENLFLGAGTADKIVLVEFKADSLKRYTGKSLAEVARLRGTNPEETAMDLVVKDGSRVGTVYFLMSEANVRREVTLPWVSFGSDAAAQPPQGVFLESNPHPRTYGNFARLLAKYVRDEQVVTLQEAVRRLTSFPAENLKLRRRGTVRPGYYADIAIFDVARIQDHATFERPHQLATGMVHVFVNGVQVLRNGEHTGAKPGRVVRGPGWTGWKARR